VSAERFTEHLEFPQGKGLEPAGAFIGAAGGAACGDLVSLRLRIEGGRVAAAGFDASGCGAASAAG
jgi:tRNA-uridine 2-sulfurtransferase